MRAVCYRVCGRAKERVAKGDCGIGDYRFCCEKLRRVARLLVKMLICVILALMLINSVLTTCGFDQWKKLYLVRWGLGLSRRSKGGEVVLFSASLKKRRIQKKTFII
jgi:hypothetical protein